MKILVAFVIVLCTFINPIYAQNALKIKVVDKLTNEAVAGATITAPGYTGKTDDSGIFSINFTEKQIRITSAGFKPLSFYLENSTSLIKMEQEVRSLSEIVVTAGRSAQARSEAPVAISSVTAQMLQDTRPVSLDQVLNKTSGVFMVNLGNEQHQMSIRQPMTTKSLFLYLEDGIPVRTTGLYNHNALLEMNMVAARQIEVIRGPASAMYGAEAIGGVVNMVTLSPPAYSSGHVNVQGNTNGYSRMDLQYGNTIGKAGILFSGYVANRTGGQLKHSDFDKTAITLKGNYIFNNRTSLVNSISISNYMSDMFGALDSAHFAGKDFSSLYNFTYRKVDALRIKSQINRYWNHASETRLAFIYRNNSIKQNPSYRIRNDFKRLPNGTFTGDPMKAHGEINNSSFNTYAVFLQHDQKLDAIKSKITTGFSADVSPSQYLSNYIAVDKDVRGYFTGYTRTDSVLSRYQTDITNMASYVNVNVPLISKIQLVAALRYDFYHYNYRNSLAASSYSGAPSAKSNFGRFTPKIGATYNYKAAGFYLNYSQGFVPPQISELYQGVKIPYLQPQAFFNYETGGWMELLDGRLFADWSIYRMNGRNEIISVLGTDGAVENKNAGKTSHTGIEYGLNFTPGPEWSVRLSASNSRHIFIQHQEKGISYNGNTMSAAPSVIANAEVTANPRFLKDLKISAEWQKQGNYWMDNANTKKYDGFNIFNVRSAYRFRQLEFWINVMNVGNCYYSVSASKSGNTQNFNLGEPRTYNSGLAYYLGRKK